MFLYYLLSVTYKLFVLIIYIFYLYGFCELTLSESTDRVFLDKHFFVEAFFAVGKPSRRASVSSVDNAIIR